MLISTLGTLLSYSVYLPAAEQCYLVNIHPRRYQVIGKPGARRIPRARCLFFLGGLRLLPLFLSVHCLAQLHATPLRLPWWPALSVTNPAVGNRILHCRRHRRRHRGYAGSRHCHNAAFLTNSPHRRHCTLYLSQVFDGGRNSSISVYDSVLYMRFVNRQQLSWPGFEWIEISMSEFGPVQCQCHGPFRTRHGGFCFSYLLRFPSISLSLPAAVPLEAYDCYQGFRNSKECHDAEVRSDAHGAPVHATSSTRV
jgi:hypothetical protein